MRIKKRQKKEILRFSEYMVSGGAQFWSGYIAYAAFDQLFNIDFWPAKIASYFFGVCVNFFLERFWVFSGRKMTKKQIETSAGRYFGLMALNFMLDLIIVGGLRQVGVSPYIGQFISSGFFTVWNYLLFKFWVFSKQRRARA